MDIRIDVGFSGYIRGDYEIDKDQLLEDMYDELENVGECLKGDTLENKAKFWIERNYFRYLGEKIMVRDDTDSDIYVEIR